MSTDYAKAVQLCEEILQEDPENVDATWIKSMAYSNLANTEDDESRQQEYFEKANQLAERAIELDGNNPDAHYSKAVALGRKAEHAGAREGVGLTREIKEFSDNAIELKEDHAGAWFVRGMLMYEVANLSRTQRFAANAIFGGLPFDADNDKAIETVGKAVELNPDNIYYRYQYGRILKEDGRNDKAREILEPTLDLDPFAQDDEKHLQSVRDLLADL